MAVAILATCPGVVIAGANQQAHLSSAARLAKRQACVAMPEGIEIPKITEICETIVRYVLRPSLSVGGDDGGVASPTLQLCGRGGEGTSVALNLIGQ